MAALPYSGVAVGVPGWSMEFWYCTIYSYIILAQKNEKQTTQALDGLKAEAGPTNTTLTWSVKTTLPVGLFRFQSPDRLTLGRKPW